MMRVVRVSSFIARIVTTFQQAIDFFRGKQNLATNHWADIWQAMHDKSFVVAGATAQALLDDLRAAVDKSISQGTSIEEFRDDFKAIVAKHGWEYNGGFAWRTRVIFETNLIQSYNAGRYRQLMALKDHHWWLYFHDDGVIHPRPIHKNEWHGLIIHREDPWWDMHFPSNGWGCQCKVFGLNERQMKKRIAKRDGVSIADAQADTAPIIVWQQHVIGKRSAHPRLVIVPRGIDPGFAFTPGKTTWEAHKKALGL